VIIAVRLFVKSVRVLLCRERETARMLVEAVRVILEAWDAYRGREHNYRGLESVCRGRENCNRCLESLFWDWKLTAEAVRMLLKAERVITEAVRLFVKGREYACRGRESSV
jgi:hypothetical protein